MPTYDYQCRACGSVTEVIHSMLEEGPSVCERCGGELRRILYPAGIIFKGSGFYRTDSRSDSKPASSSASDAKSAAPKSDAASGDSASSSATGGSGDSGGTSTAKDGSSG